MSEQSSSSFIPKKPVRGSSRPRPVKRVYLISIVSSVLFVAALLASGGLFIYTISLEQELTSEQQRLNQQRETFSQSDLQRVLEFEARLQAANQLLNQQVYIPTLFRALEDTVLQSTVYRGLEYEKEGPNRINVTLETTNPTFDGVLFQREVFASNPTLQGVSITDVSFTSIDNNQQQQQTADVANEVQFTIEHDLNNTLLERSQTTNTQSTEVNSVTNTTEPASPEETSGADNEVDTAESQQPNTNENTL